ncbi:MULTISPECIES: hypothetical protein [unclassified Rathayibacter]|uniref:hypothetical protein n=1 Tax=unclassified Rathayibacter TaxID=2609250 RepID=UPI0012F8852E|nr:MULTISPECIES: hypothetical protein [unclassified Rathayibacter]
MPTASTATVPDPVRHFLRRAEVAAQVGRLVFFVVIAGSLVLVGSGIFGAVQHSYRADASAASAASAASHLTEAKRDAKGAQYRKDVAWEELQYDQQNAAQIYDVSVARGVKNGSIPAPAWPATVGYDAGLKAELDTAVAASAAEYSPVVEEFEDATERLEDATDASADALATAAADRAVVNGAWSWVGVAALIAAVATVVAAGLWFVLSNALVRARATVALSERTGSRV